MKTQGELGKAIASLVLSYSTRDLQQMRWNFSGAIQDINPELRKKLEETITGHLHGTYQALRLMDQQGSFTPYERTCLQRMRREYWKMVVVQCSAGDAEQVRLRFLKFLISGFCMFVQDLPATRSACRFPAGTRSR